MRLALLLLAACSDSADVPVDAAPDALIIRVSCTVPSVWGYNGRFCGVTELSPVDVAHFESVCIADNDGTIGSTCSTIDLIGTCDTGQILQFFYLGGDETPDQLANDCRARDGHWR